MNGARVEFSDEELSADNQSVPIRKLCVLDDLDNGLQAWLLRFGYEIWLSFMLGQVAGMYRLGPAVINFIEVLKQ